MCHISKTCDVAAYNREKRICELGKKELGENSLSAGWDLYAVTCPAGWEYFENSCFILETKKLTWTSANENCANKTSGAHLAYAKTERKNKHLISLFAKTYPEGINRFWLGGKRKGHRFYWGDDTPLVSGFRHWRSGEPNNNDGNEHCLSNEKKRIRSAFLWNDIPCHLAVFSFCEKELI